jgi:hypothetical protein
MVRAVVTALALFLTGAALADDWKEYENQNYSFTIHFPVDPTVETAVYQAADGHSFPAHVFWVKQETGTFKVTVVEMPGEETGPNAAVMKEANRASRPRCLRPGNWASPIQMAATPTSPYSIRIIASQIEGNAFVAGGQAEVDAARFQQSLDLT